MPCVSKVIDSQCFSGLYFDFGIFWGPGVYPAYIRFKHESPQDKQTPFSQFSVKAKAWKCIEKLIHFKAQALKSIENTTLFNAQALKYENTAADTSSVYPLFFYFPPPPAYSRRI